MKTTNHVLIFPAGSLSEDYINTHYKGETFNKQRISITIGYDVKLISLADFVIAVNKGEIEPNSIIADMLKVLVSHFKNWTKKPIFPTYKSGLMKGNWLLLWTKNTEELLVI